MSDPTTVISTGARLVNIRELLVLILEHLACEDLLRAQTVSRFWYETLLRTESLARIAFKKAESPQEGTPSTVLKELSREIFDNTAAIFYKQSQRALVMLLEDPWENIRDYTFANAAISIRRGCPERVQGQFLRDYYCGICWGIHGPPVLSRIHPLLRRTMNRIPMCINGLGPQIVLSMDFGRGDYSKVRVIKRTVDHVECVYNILEGVFADIKAFHLESDMLTRPGSTRVIVTDAHEFEVQDRKDGVEVLQAFRAMAGVCFRVLHMAKASTMRLSGRSIPIPSRLKEFNDLAEHIERLIRLYVGLMKTLIHS